MVVPGILLSLLVFCWTGSTEGVCTWPAYFANTVWQDAVQGELTFTDQTMTGWDLITEKTTISAWQCHSTDWLESSSFLVIRSVEQFDQFDFIFYGYLCLYLVQITDNSFRYYIYNPEQSNLGNARVRIDLSENVQDVDLLCSGSPGLLSQRPTSAEYRVMIKTGSEAVARIDCPYVFLGKYDYTHAASSGTVTCSASTDTLDTCTDHSSLAFSYDTCSTRIAYSAADTVSCVDTVPVNDDNYITVYNDQDTSVDGASTFRFTCIAVSSDGKLASVSPDNCKKDQTPGSLPVGSPAATLQLTRSESCESCPGLTPPDGGNVSYSTDGAVTMATYACGDQYSLAGSASRECQADHSWASNAPTCTCATPPSPVNGNVSLSADGSTLSYSCDAGYVLVGPGTRSCDTNSNTWTGADPTCNTCDEIMLTLGLNTSQTVQGTTTVTAFTCATGFTLSGEPTSTCQSDGSWLPAIPSCAQCPDIALPSSGFVSVTTDGHSSTATFTCVTSYSLVGMATLTCDATGAWSGDQPSCHCDDPASIVNGTFIANGTHVMYSCDVGYNLGGDSSRTCSEDGSWWSSTAPSCEPCGEIAARAGELHELSTDGQTTTATFSCVAGYTLTGSRAATCQPDTGWTLTHSCVACDNLTAPPSGNITMTTDGTTSVAVYNCSSGYSVAGEVTRVCQADGTWLPDTSPTCYCSPVSAPADGAVLADDGREAYYECDLGYTLNGTSVRICAVDGGGWSGTDPSCVPCPALASTVGGSSITSTDGTVTRAEFTCDVGYTISGKTTLTCLTTGDWDNTQPTCAPCISLDAVDGGNVALYSDGNTVTKANFTCDVGYSISGATLLTCDSLGQWDLTQPTCAACSSRSAPSSGSLALTTDGHTTTATYACAAGYSLSGQSTVTCRSDGHWNAPAPACSCETPAAPANGSVSVSSDTVTYGCDVGFTMSGDSTGTCQTDGSGWSISTPICETCDALVDVIGGNLTLTTDGLATTVVYTCDTGATLRGSPVVSCNSSGAWETEQPTCVSCPSLATVSSGSVIVSSNGTTTSAIYSCATGYHLTGSSQLVCTTEGNWSAEEPRCLCDSPSVPTGGSYNISEDGQSISYFCDVGYSIDGTNNITCDSDGGGWTVSQPTCVHCPTLSEPAGGTFSIATTGTISQANYSCDVGSSMDGEPYSVCTTDGTWNASAPSCVECPSLANVTSGTLSLATDGQTTTASYICADMYDLVGAAMLTCSSTGSWDQAPPTCHCTVPDPPTNGTVTVTADRSTLTYTCNAGYVMNGPATRTCQASGLGWTDSAPSCVTCNNLEAPSKGSVSLTTDGSVTTATYHCNSGFSLSGDTQVTCQADGTWQGQIPTCVQCPGLSAPDSGDVTTTTDGVTPSANYTCATGYYIVGHSYLTCNSSGTWSATQPSCACERVTAPANGSTSYADDDSLVSYSCDVGFSLAGDATRTCATDGSGWNGTDPVCVTCPDVSEAVNSSHVLVSDGTVTSVEYQCDQGSSLSGQTTLECHSDGTWSGTAPTCVSCTGLSTPDSGSVTVSTDGVTTTAVYACSPGYEPVGGAAVLQCQADGSWSAPEPSCNCVAPQAPVAGHVTLSDNNSSATYSCDLHYSLQGDAVTWCQQDGAGWNGTQPSCVQCLNLTVPTNGNKSTATSGQQTFTSFSCDVGTSLRGDAVIYCQTDGTWTSSEPTCVSCAVATSPDSGSVTVETNGSVTTATYTCATGYYADGDSVLTCSTTGQWSAAFPTCVCSSPGTIADGAVVSDGRTASYSCNRGHTLSGATTSTCLAGGAGWDSTLPTCVECEGLVTPINGSVVMSTNGTTSTADFRCDVGTTISGTQHLKCLINGSWDSAYPTCVSCGSLGSPANGEYIQSTDGTTTTVTLQCQAGYEARGIITSTCDSDGTWTTHGQGYCEEEGGDSKTVSYLTALVIVAVLSALIITTLSILLAVFIRLYRRKNDALIYRSDIPDTDSSSTVKNGRIHHHDNEPTSFTIPDGKMTPSMAPTSHQRHVLDLREGSFVISPAPSGHGRHVTEAGASPRGPPPLDTGRSGSSLTSLDSGGSSSMLSSVASLSSVSVAPGRPPARLRPLSAHHRLVDKVQKWAVPGSTPPSPSPRAVRPTTPVSHSISSTATDDTDTAISDVCN